MRRRKAALALLLAVCLCLSCAACQTEQDDIYSKALSQAEEAKNQVASGPPVDHEDPGYLGLETPPPEERATPMPGDDLHGELTVRIYWPGGFEANVQTLANEFMKLHP